MQFSVITKTEEVMKMELARFTRPLRTRRLLPLLLVLTMFSAPALADESTAHLPNSVSPVAENEPVKLADIEVKATKALKEGSAESGYRVESVAVGPLGNKNMLDLPYSVNVVPSELIENQQTTGMAAITKYVPSAQYEARGGMYLGRPQTRGMEGSVSENNRMEGMNIAVTTAYPMEQFEQIEVLNSVAGTLFGPAAPSGVFNFVLKRPTNKPLYRLTLGNVSYDDQSHTFYHLDLGGPLGKSFGYRVNLLYDEGKEWANSSYVKRNLASVAFDWRILPTTVAELNFSYYDFLEKGFPAGFTYTKAITSLPDALDPTRAGYGQKWAGYNLSTRTASIRIKHDFSDNWHLTAGYLNQAAPRNVFQILNTLTDNNGNYKTTLGALPNANSTTWIVNSEILNLDGRVMTGSITHDIVLGTNGHQRSNTALRTPFTIQTLGTANVNNPISYDEPAWQQKLDSYKSSILKEQVVTAGDTVSYKSLSALISTSYSWMRTVGYNASGAKTSTYEDDGFSFATSLMYKPFDKMMLYVSYGDSLQQGATAPVTAANANETLAPYRSTQYETGIKATVHKIDLTTALFRIERPYPYTDANNVFKVQGNQVNYGLEMMATGEIVDRVTLYSGITFLDPRLKDTGNSATNKKYAIGVPKIQSNLFVEYRMPFISGLTPSLNVHYTGKRAANAENTNWAKAYTTVDLGVRYATKIFENETTWRLTVNNLLNERYWASVMPSNINGGGNANTAYLGSPREIIASMQLKF